MKTIVKRKLAPTSLAVFQANDPTATWDKFRRSKSNRQELQQQIFQDQRGLCAYCEIDLVLRLSDAQSNDFRVDHFHPKTPHVPPPNWALDWPNMLGCCHGGSSNNVLPNLRFSSNHQDHSCDVPKKNFNWTGQVLNPLTDIPNAPSLFFFDTHGSSAGEIKVNTSSPSHLQPKARASIQNHRLNATRLKRMRAEVILKLNRQVHDRVLAGESIDAVMNDLAQCSFPDSQSSNWPAFFTCIRFVLGSAAETRLQSINYPG